MTIEEHPHEREERRPWWFLPALIGIVLGGLVGLGIPESFLRQEDGPASSCEQRTWPTMEISCRDARNTSVTSESVTGAPGPWTMLVWLTTLDAVDARLHPQRQVADHPSTGAAPVWLFIYENPGTGDRVLHVAAASNAKRGAFIYIHRWSDLGSPV